MAFAAVCLTMIATLSLARAQMSGIAPGSYWASAGPYWPPPYGLPPAAYGPAPSRYGPPPGGIHVITNGPRTNPGDVSRSWSAQRNVVESDTTRGCLRKTRRSARRVFARSVARLGTGNFIGSASTALLDTNLYCAGQSQQSALDLVARNIWTPRHNFAV